jgi:AraC-like DNA-binding protein
MSQKRHDDIVVRSLAMRYSARHELERHEHAWHQLVYAREGVMSVDTERGAWVVPPQRAAWVPAGTEHAIAMCGPVDLRTLYFRADFSNVPRACSVMQVTPLLRELVLHVVSVGLLRDSDETQLPLARVLVDQISSLDADAFWLPMPRDARAKRIADALHENPASKDTIDVLAKRAGASPRTLERLFQNETGLTFGRWRQQLRLVAAARRLGGGESVTNVALEVGYDSASAFIAAFRGAFGVTPGRYF